MPQSNILLWVLITVLLVVIVWLAWRLWQANRSTISNAAPPPHPLDRSEPAVTPPRRSSAPPPASAGGDATAATAPRPSSRDHAPAASAGQKGGPVGPSESYGQARPRTSKPPPAMAGHVPGVTPQSIQQARPRSAASRPPAASAGGARNKADDRNDPEPAHPASKSSGATPAAALTAVRSWGYQLQDLDLAEAADSPFDLIVIDYSKDGGDEGALSPADLARLKRKPDGTRRLVYAYISVGEAESYRYYWQRGWKKNPPPWIIAENPEWKENYLVRFWLSEWPRILIGGDESYVAHIAAAGFDGLYLDRCDVFEEIAEHHRRVAAERTDVEADMIRFIEVFSKTVRLSYPGLGIIMQNAEQLLVHAAVRKAIDAVAKEELLYGVDASQKRNTVEAIEGSRRALDLIREDGKPVFTVEYLDKADLRFTATDETRSLGYVPYISRKDRELATLEADQPEAAVA